ncbi:MAG: type II toxin-antitoxin system RelE/ParE family toxin [Treponema sp.]|nr:type II toxin-antitoxin system RelE/ParE family toxin [Treponema sp.]
MNKLIISDSAKADIRETLTYIKETLHNPKAASTLADTITEELHLLVLHPKSGPVVNDPFLAECGIRSLLINNYRAFYSIQEESDSTTVNIIRFLYARRDFETILKNEIVH